jgi:hypothetical protein
VRERCAGVAGVLIVLSCAVDRCQRTVWVLADLHGVADSVVVIIGIKDVSDAITIEVRRGLPIAALNSIIDPITVAVLIQIISDRVTVGISGLSGVVTDFISIR